MVRLAVLALLMPLASGCSYTYDLNTTIIDGQLLFDANPDWGADCIRQITIEAESGELIWQQSVSHEDSCANTFPITYGVPLEGERLIYPANTSLPEQIRGQPAPMVSPKPLQPDTIYRVHTTTGSTGYGCGRFRLLEDRSIESLGCN